MMTTATMIVTTMIMSAASTTTAHHHQRQQISIKLYVFLTRTLVIARTHSNTLATVGSLWRSSPRLASSRRHQGRSTRSLRRRARSLSPRRGVAGVHYRCHGNGFCRLQQRAVARGCGSIRLASGGWPRRRVAALPLHVLESVRAC